MDCMDPLSAIDEYAKATAEQQAQLPSMEWWNVSAITDMSDTFSRYCVPHSCSK